MTEEPQMKAVEATAPGPTEKDNLCCFFVTTFWDILQHTDMRLGSFFWEILLSAFKGKHLWFVLAQPQQ